MKPRPVNLPSCRHLAMASLALGLQSIQAAELYWDLNGTTANSGSAATGNWNGSTANWNSDSTGGAGGTTTATSAAADNLFFSSGTGYTSTSSVVSITGTQSANSISFEEGTVTIRSTGTIAFGSGSSEINVASGRTGAINSLVTGSNGLTKTGAGTLMLGTTTNSGGSGGIYNSGLTGTITINEGRLVAGSNASNQNATNGQAISLGNTTGTAAATFSVNRNQDFNSSITVNAGSTGVKRISGGPGLAVNQSPTITGAIALNDHVTLGNGSGGDVGGVNLSGVITGSKNITVDGATQYTDATTLGSIAVIRGASGSSFTGNVSINRGTLRIGNTGAIGTGTATVTTAVGSALDLSNGGAAGSSISIAGLSNGTTTGGTVINHATGTATATLTLAGSSAYSYGGVIADGATSKVGLTVNLGSSGSQTLTGDNSYTGNTIVSAGTLYVNGSLGNTAVSVGSNGTIGGTGSIGGSVAFADGAKLTINLADILTVSGPVSFANFGFDDLVDFDVETAEVGTHTLLAGSSIDFTNVQNFGIENAFIRGDGYKAYFESGSLAVVIAVPETSTFALTAVGGFALLRRRRR